MKIFSRLKIFSKTYPIGKAPKPLPSWVKNLLKEGNLPTFAELVLDFYPDICKSAKFTDKDRVNNYKAFCEFHNDSSNPVFELFGKNGIKYFFDTEMKFRGTKV